MKTAKSTPELSLGTIVRVIWIDSTAYGGWEYHKDTTKINFAPRHIRTVGHLVGINPIAYLVAPSVSRPEQDDTRTGLMDSLVIPRGCILKIEALYNAPR